MENGQISMMDILVETYKRLYSKYKQHCGYAAYIGKKI